MLLCEWHNKARSQHWKEKKWLSRVSLTPGSEDIALESLVDQQKVLLPPLHIKLGFVKQFEKDLQRYGKCFKHICSNVLDLSKAKL
jgi:hypothetical protein